MDEIEKIFSGDNHLYGRTDIDTFSVSGCGSQMDNSTLNVRENLYNFLIKYNIKSIFDAPCGDYWWMRHVDLKEIEYIGGDIITEQMKKLNKNFPDKKFIRFDVIKDKFPDVDLLFCRDCLFHFSKKDKIMTFENFINSNIKYLLMSNHPLSTNNLGEPVDILYDSNSGYDTKELQLYTKEQILKYLKNG
jgi:hypothetical protein